MKTMNSDLSMDSDLGLTKADLIRMKSRRSLQAQYDIVEKIGDGAFGAVFKAKEKHKATYCVWKEVNTSTLDSHQLVQMKQEIEVLRKLDHPNIVQIMEYAEDPQSRKLYLVMELLSGGDCHHLLRKANGWLDESFVAKCIWHLLLGISYCHLQDVLHCDIKPSNMMIANGGGDLETATIKVIDFGLAKILNSQGVANSHVEGTLVYMTPETLQQLPPDYPADYWGIGATAFELVTGWTPYPSCTDPWAYLRTMMQTEPNWELPVWQERSNMAKEFCRGCLEKNPDERLDVRTALSHEWICSQDHRKQKRKITDALQQFGYGDAPHFELACCLLIAVHLAGDEFDDLAGVFEELSNEEGTISVDNLAGALYERQNWLWRDRNFAQHCAERADVNGDGLISFTEFVAASIHHRLKGEDLARHAFDLFKHDGSGKLSLHEISSVLESPHVKAFQRKANVDYLDVVRPLLGHKGKMDFHQFRELLRSSEIAADLAIPHSLSAASVNSASPSPPRNASCSFWYCSGYSQHVEDEDDWCDESPRSHSYTTSSFRPVLQQRPAFHIR